MTDKRIDAIIPIANGENLKSLKMNGSMENYAQIRKNSEPLFSQRLKAMVSEEISLREKSLPKPGEAGLNPVRPKLEKQGDVRTAPVSDGNASGESMNKPANAEQKPVNAEQNPDSQNTAVNSGEVKGESTDISQAVVDTDTESFRKIITDNRQLLLMQLQGLFAPEASVKQQIAVDPVQQGQVAADNEITSDALLNVVGSNTTENDIDISESVSEKPQKDNSGKVFDAGIYKGTLADLIKQGEITFGDITVLTVTEKGIYIGGEGDSLEDSANFVDGDFLQTLLQGLSSRLKNKDESADGEEPEKMLLPAIYYAVSQMHDPVKQEDEYQKKLVEFLMKFVDRINGKDDKETALNDGEEDENESNLLLQLVENLIEAAEKADDDTTAAVYATAYGIDILYYDEAQPQLDKNDETTDESEEVQTVETKEAAAINTEKAAVKEAIDTVNADSTVKTVIDENAAVTNAYTYVQTDDAQNAVQPEQKAEGVALENVRSVETAQVQPAAPKFGFKFKIKGASEEMDELKRLFGGYDHKEEDRIRERNEIMSESEEDTENSTENQNTAGKEQGISKVEDKDDFSKNILESVTLENIKIEAPAAKTFVPNENAAKQVISQIINEMLNNMPKTERTVTTLTMTLNPETLGKITMKVSQEAGKVSLMVTAHNRETAELLSHRLDAVQQAAKDSGTQLEKYQVVYAPEQEGRAGQQNYEGSSKNPYVRRDDDEQNTDSDGSFAELLQEAV